MISGFWVGGRKALWFWRCAWESFVARPTPSGPGWFFRPNVEWISSWPRVSLECEKICHTPSTKHHLPRNAQSSQAVLRYQEEFVLDANQIPRGSVSLFKEWPKRPYFDTVSPDKANRQQFNYYSTLRVKWDSWFVEPASDSSLESLLGSLHNIFDISINFTRVPSTLPFTPPLFSQVLRGKKTFACTFGEFQVWLCIVV
jgi:hypothetical protein